MPATRDRRENPRLRLCYPVETRVDEPGEAGSSRAVTVNLGARGTYYKTFAWAGFRIGQRVSVRVVVPHTLRNGERDIRLDMHTRGRVLRLERVDGREALGEDGICLFGVAIAFDRPLEFRWDFE